MLNAQYPAISSPRLDLIVATPAFYEASMARNEAMAESLIGAKVLPDWLEQRWIMEIFTKKLAQNPAYQPFSLRAMVLREEQTMIGHIGFHTPPDPTYLNEIAPGGVEFGYTVFPAYRQQGYALEASKALIHWANEEHLVSRFVLSISPDNVPSRKIAARLGFTQVGTQMDDEDGPEDIFRLDIPLP